MMAILRLLKILAVFCYSTQMVAAQVTAPQGAKGEKGSKGEIGVPGANGTKGDIGIPGPQGQKGEPGFTGTPGGIGNTGATGDVGTAGNEGSVGLPGIKGEVGIMGVTGNNGSTGATGGVGNPGLEGLKGPKGNKGARGDPGVAGESGQKGEVGIKGIEGIQGEIGDQGDQGSVGIPGQSLLEQDIDECATSGGNSCDLSTTLCVNTITSYKCVCKEGYYRPTGANDSSCKDIDECVTDNGGCHGNCTNTIGSYQCLCPPGTRPSDDKQHQCVDINECSANSDTCGDNPDIYCVNTYASSSCVSSQGDTQETSAKTPIAQSLMVEMMRNSWVPILLAWFAVLTLIAIVILIWLICIFQRMKKERKLRESANYMYNNAGADNIEEDEADDIGVGEGMAGSAAVHIDIPQLPRSRGGTMKGKQHGSTKGSKSYKSGSRSSRPASLSSSTGSEMKTASVRQHRVAAGERNSANRLSGVDTFY